MKRTDLQPETIWRPPPPALTLAGSEVHVWRAALDSACAARLEPLLSPDERARADRFRFPRDRARFVVARGTLRLLLARYLSLAPDQLQLRYGARGKPSLASGAGENLKFNLSHSDDLALFAFSHGRELGVDLEQIRPEVATGPIAERFLAPGEVAHLRSLPPEAQPAAFFACWTRKEAYIKARGEGLYLSLQQFEVSLLPGEPAALLRVAGDAGQAARWTLTALDPGPGFAAALAVEGRGCCVRCWQWTG